MSEWNTWPNPKTRQTTHHELVHWVKLNTICRSYTGLNRPKCKQIKRCLVLWVKETERGHRSNPLSLEGHCLGSLGWQWLHIALVVNIHIQWPWCQPCCQQSQNYLRRMAVHNGEQRAPDAISATDGGNSPIPFVQRHQLCKSNCACGLVRCSAAVDRNKCAPDTIWAICKKK